MSEGNGGPPPKRKRKGSTTSQNTNATRSSIWMRRGDLVLEAESTQFRVHSDILAKQSPIFEDMLFLPQPENDLTVDGCSVVQVSDSAKDWEALLDMLYDPCQYGEGLPIQLLAAMLRLGKKYEMANIKTNATSRIHYECPKDFDAWSHLPGDFTKISVPVGGEFDLLTLAHECGIKTSLPLLGFICLNLASVDALINHQYTRGDGSPIILSTDLKLTLAVAAERMSAYRKSAFEWLENASVIPHNTCTTRTRCKGERQKIYRTCIWGEENLRYPFLGTWSGEWVKDLCITCQSFGKSRYDSKRTETWQKLPGFFGLPAWEELKDDD